MLIVIDFNRTLYDPNHQSLNPGAMEFLKEASDKAKIILYAKGKTREKLIDDLGIRKFFFMVKLVDEKEPEDFTKMSEIDKVRYSIGDRVVKEIRYANESGFKTIWYRSGKFALEQPKTDMEKPDFIVNTFDEIMPLLR